MVLQKILRDLILIAQPFSCSFRKWVLFYTRSAITLSVEGEQSFASVPASLAFLWRLWGIWGKFDCNWHSQCPVRPQSSQSKTLYAGTKRCKVAVQNHLKLCWFVTVLYCLLDPIGLQSCMTFLRRCGLQGSLQSVKERVNDWKGRKGRMQLWQRVTRFRSQNEKQKCKPRLKFLKCLLQSRKAL